MIPGSPVRFLLLICLASAGWAFSFGVGTQVVSHWLRAQDLSDGAIGLNHSTYYLGLALAALLVPWMMRRWGRACAPAGMVLSSVTLALFPWAGGPVGWFAMRLLNGAAAGLSLIPLETLISTASPSRQKTRNFGVYSVALTLGGALGIRSGLHFQIQTGTAAFLLGSIAPFVAGLALFRWLPGCAPAAEARPERQAPDFQRHFLSYGTGWSQGFLEGGMLAFLSFFLMSLGMSAGAAGDLMGVTMVGVILFQVPVSWLADRFGRMPVLLGCYTVVLAALLVLPFCAASLWLAVWLFLFGACSGAFYPLGLALLGEGAGEERLPRLFAWYMAMECFGSQMGAALMGKARDWWGEGAMFAVGFAAVAGVLLAWLGLRLAAARRGRQIASQASNEERRAA
jgi:MFS family permease